jgi:hypothetical protein
LTNKVAEVWLIKNYDKLWRMAKARNPKDPAALISHLTLYINRDFTKIQNITDHDGQMKFCQIWMKNQVKWRRSNLNLDSNLGKIDLGELDDTVEKATNNIDDLESQNEIELSAEIGELGQMAKVILDWQRQWSDLEIQKIMKIKLVIKEKLDDSEKIFINMYIQQSLSLRQIAEKTRLPLSAVWSILQKVKLKIKTILDDDNFI